MFLFRSIDIFVRRAESYLFLRVCLTFSFLLQRVVSLVTKEMHRYNILEGVFTPFTPWDDSMEFGNLSIVSQVDTAQSTFVTVLFDRSRVKVSIVWDAPFSSISSLPTLLGVGVNVRCCLSFLFQNARYLLSF